MTEDAASLLRDPEFQELLKVRSRWRWGLTGLLIGAYTVYALGGLYYADFYAQPFGDSSMPRGIAFGLILIGLSIVLSFVYIRVINNLKTFTTTSAKQ